MLPKSDIEVGDLVTVWLYRMEKPALAIVTGKRIVEKLALKAPDDDNKECVWQYRVVTEGVVVHNLLRKDLFLENEKPVRQWFQYLTMDEEYPYYIS